MANVLYLCLCAAKVSERVVICSLHSSIEGGSGGGREGGMEREGWREGGREGGRKGERGERGRVFLRNYYVSDNLT